MAFYLFPKTMFKRYLKVTDIIRSHSKELAELRTVLTAAHQLYELCTTKYYGMGLFLQFIPGTDANKARKQLMDKLEPALTALKQEFSKQHANYYSEFQTAVSWMKKAYHSSLESYFHVKPWYLLLDDIVAGFKHQTYKKNQNKTLRTLFLELPVIKDLWEMNDQGKMHFKKNALYNVGRSIINPLRLLDDAINALHSALGKLVEKILGNKVQSQRLKFITKLILGVIFGTFSAPVKLLKHTVELLPLHAMKALIVEPGIHLTKSLLSAYNNRDKATLTLTAKEMREIKEFRQSLKGRTADYSTISKRIDYATTYIGTEKGLLYSKSTPKDPRDKLVTIQAPKQKIEKLAGLLIILKHGKDKGQSIKTIRKDKEAIEQARKYYPAAS